MMHLKKGLGKNKKKKLNPKNSRWEERIKIRNDINKIKIKSHTKN